MHPEIVHHILLRINTMISADNIKLRNLEEKDAPFMLEWMHDPEIQKAFKKNMLDATIEDAKSFINKSKMPVELATGMSLHYAIVDREDDQYLGTISLKDVDLENGTAEYAITTRKLAHGKGIAYKATKLILEKAFQELRLRRVFLSVHADNTAAIKLYEKSGFKFEGEFREHFFIAGKLVGWKWYGMLREEYCDK